MKFRHMAFLCITTYIYIYIYIYISRPFKAQPYRLTTVNSRFYIFQAISKSTSGILSFIDSEPVNIKPTRVVLTLTGLFNTYWSL
jgi:hypothetical protein